MKTITIDGKEYYLTSKEDKQGFFDNCEPGAFLFATDAAIVFIYNGLGSRDYTNHKVVEYVCCLVDDKTLKVQKGDEFMGYVVEDNHFRYATVEEKTKLMCAIQNAGYEWDAENLELRRMLDDVEKTLYDWLSSDTNGSLTNSEKRSCVIRRAPVISKAVMKRYTDKIAANMLEDKLEGLQRDLVEFLSNVVGTSWGDIQVSADAYARKILHKHEKELAEAYQTQDDVVYKNGIEKGREEALKGLVWRPADEYGKKIGRGFTCDCLVMDGYYLPLAELKKLPKAEEEYADSE